MNSKTKRRVYRHQRPTLLLKEEICEIQNEKFQSVFVQDPYFETGKKSHNTEKIYRKYHTQKL